MAQSDVQFINVDFQFRRQQRGKFFKVLMQVAVVIE